MHLELIECVCCPVVHRESVLVAAADNVQARFIVDGVLGCPECGAEFRITNGVTNFTTGSPHTDHPARQRDVGVNEREAAMRVAAGLALTEGRSVYAIIGFPFSFALTLQALVPARLVIINPALNAHSLTIGSSAPTAIIACGDTLPLVGQKFYGIALAPDVFREPAMTLNAESIVTQAAAAIRAGGRLVAPIAASMPGDFVELARDETVWVAQRAGTTSAPVEIRRR